MRRLIRRPGAAGIMALALLAGACANPAFPRGGPVDTSPPRVLITSPADSAVSVRVREIEFLFDEVVGERPSGVPSLAALFMISPGLTEPRVSWRRRALVVRPREELLPNTTYTITLLPGVVDLQSNVMRGTTSIVFSTGTEIHRSTLTGIVFDWVSETPIPRALVQAALVPPPGDATTIRSDSLYYQARADSTGRFTIRNIPDGVFDVRAFQDLDSDRRPGRGEMFDSVRVSVSDSARVEILAFVRDSVPPRMASVTVRDSFSVLVRLTRPLSPAQQIDTSLFRLFTGQDSTVVPLALAREEARFEGLAGRDSALVPDSLVRPDSAAAQRADPARLVQAVVPSRPRPPQSILIQTSAALTPGARYILRAGELTGLLGTRDVPPDITFTVPERAPAAAPPRTDTLSAPLPSPGGSP